MLNFRLYNRLILILAIFLMPESAHAWFQNPSATNGKNLPVFQYQSNQEMPSGTLLLLPNGSRERDTYVVSGGIVKGDIISSADKIDVDVPFTLLLKTEIHAGDAVDREITANLRLKNILDQYVDMRQKTQKLLEELRIPYLDGSTKKPELSENRPREQEIRRKISDVLFLRAHNWDRSLLYDHYVSAIDGEGDDEGNDKRISEPILQLDRSDVSSSTDAGPKSYSKSVHPGDLPWIVRVVLEFIRFVFENKVEILLWLTGAVVSMSIGIWVIRR